MNQVSIFYSATAVWPHPYTQQVRKELLGNSVSSFVQFSTYTPNELSEMSQI